MFDLPPDLPPPVAAHEQVIDKCSVYAGHVFNVHPFILKAIAEVEGGKIGTIRKNTNGSLDLGVMQINTINLKRINKRFPSVDWRKLAYSPCISIGVAAWILSKEMARVADFWKGVGNYHSRTPRFRNIYLAKVKRAYAKILKKNKRKRTRVISVIGREKTENKKVKS